MILQTLLVIFFLVLGTALIIIAAWGVIRMPDIYMRMSASTKAATLGIGCILVGAAIHFHELVFASRAIAIIFFVLLTAPVAAHRIGRAAYKDGVPLWPQSIVDELRSFYRQETGQTSSRRKRQSKK